VLDIEYRVLCPCGHRYPTKTIEGEAVCCAKCRTISPAVPEPRDELWWKWFDGPEYLREVGGRDGRGGDASVAAPYPKKEPRKIEGVPL